MSEDPDYESRLRQLHADLEAYMALHNGIIEEGTCKKSTLPEHMHMVIGANYAARKMKEIFPEIDFDGGK